MDMISKTIELAKNEMLEAQKERDSLMRWKLILVSTIGAAALGFSQNSPLPNAEFALCLIPFTCVYVDILCRNLSIRTKMISLFLAQDQKDPLETFYQVYTGPRGSSLESFALRFSTIFLSILVIPIGIISHSANHLAVITTWFSGASAIFYLSGFSGIFLSFIVEQRYQEQKKTLVSLEVSPSTTKGD
jgi:hypothetical protein